MQEKAVKVIIINKLFKMRSYRMKPLKELVFEDESALFMIRQWIRESNNCNGAVILPSFKE